MKNANLKNLFGIFRKNSNIKNLFDKFRDIENVRLVSTIMKIINSNNLKIIILIK